MQKGLIFLKTQHQLVVQFNEQSVYQISGRPRQGACFPPIFLSSYPFGLYYCVFNCFLLFVLTFLLFLSTLSLLFQFPFSSPQFQWLPGSSSLLFLLPGIPVKMSNPPIIICLLWLTYLTPVSTIIKYDELIL